MTQSHDHNWWHFFKQLGPAGILAVLWAVLPPIGTGVALWKIELISNWLRANPVAGPFVFAGALMILCGAGLLPTYASSAIGGWAFGFAVGLPSAMVGYLLACMVGYFIARRVSGEHVLSLLHEHPRWELISNSLLHATRKRTFFIIFLLRLAPNSPFALTNLLLGSTRVNPVLYFLGCALGLLPRTAAVVYAASGVERLTADFKENRVSIFVGLAVTLIVLMLISAIAKRALRQAMQMESEPQI